MRAWQAAQKAEREWWRRTLERMGKLRKEQPWPVFRDASIGYAGRRLRPILEAHNRAEKIDSVDTVLVEFGSGPIPLCSAWVGPRRRIAVDPLFSYYQKYTGLPCVGESLGVEFVKCKAEAFVFEEPADIVFMSNCLDHCDDPGKAIRNSLWNLTEGGYILLDVVARAAGTDAKHPHGWANPDALRFWLYRIPGLPDFTIPYITPANNRLFAKIVREASGEAT